jgi:hypothetical protein
MIKKHTNVTPGNEFSLVFGLEAYLHKHTPRLTLWVYFVTYHLSVFEQEGSTSMNVPYTTLAGRRTHRTIYVTGIVCSGHGSNIKMEGV